MNEERIYQVLLGAHISEKSTLIADEANQFAFRVTTDATKPEVKQAVEKIYNVNVESVRLLNVKGKTKRTFRGTTVRRPSWKKAYVRIAAGQDIDFAAS